MNFIILAGGTGSRLWPASRTLKPKQFLALTGSDETLIQSTYLRLKPLAAPNSICIIGSQKHELELLGQIQELDPEFKPEQALLEPCPKNTAPAILWGVSQIPKENWDAPLVILPSDHLIQDNQSFRETLQAGEPLAAAGELVIFGIKPDRPDTGFGYIKSGEQNGSGKKVLEFKEKPDLATAEQYLKEGVYSWNAGIFMATASSLVAAYKKHAPEIYNSFFLNDEVRAELSNYQAVTEIFQEVKADSFDYAILEKSSNISVVEMDVGWNDLGSWESLHDVSPKDENGNVSQGDVILQNCKNSLFYSKHKLIAAIGLEHLMVVEAGDSILVADLRQSQSVKHMVDSLKDLDRIEHEIHTKVRRPWGTYEVIHEADNFKIKRIMVEAGKRLSLQRHNHRNEHWVVINGNAKVTNGSNTFFLAVNESTYIPKNAIHRLENQGKLPLEIIEVQQGDYLGEDDIVRLEDDFLRTNQ